MYMRNTSKSTINLSSLFTGMNAPVRILFFTLVLFTYFLASPAVEPTHGAIYNGPGNGTTFRVFAPNASQVSVVGDFNSWDFENPFNLSKGGDSVWYGTHPTAVPNQYYKYMINDDENWLRKDPVSLRVQHSGSSAASIIEDLGTYQWSSNEANWESGAHVPPITEMVIYELHLKSFMFRNDGVPFVQNKLFDSFVEHKLDYLQELGINCIELMPVNEFPGDQSWGYNPAFWFAIESSYGSPYEFQRFVDECHKRGIAVLVDVVLNHAGPSDIEHYWDFDGGTVGSLGGNGNWFYTDWRARTPWGDTNPNFDSGYVRLRLVESIRMFIEDYHVDGVRVDSTVTIRKDNDDGYDWNGSDNPAGWSFLQYLNDDIRWRKGGKVLTIAEDIANEQWITRNTNDSNGAGFNAQWSPSPINAVVSQISDDDRDMNEVARAIGDTQGYNYGRHELVKYHSSHDSVDARNGHWRLPNRIGDPFQQITKSRAKLTMGTLILSPGTPMLFMGDEFYAIGQWDDDPDHALDWSQLESDRNFFEFSRSVIRMRRNHPAMHTNNLEMPVVDHGRKMVAFKRWDGNGDTLMVVTNWRNTEQSVPVFFGNGEDGTWHEILNSDASVYGGTNAGNSGSIQVSGGWGTVNTGPYSMVVLSKFQDQYPPARSWYPWSPTDGEANVGTNPTLYWRWASEASDYDVYFGTSFAAVDAAGTGSPEFKGNTGNPEFALSPLSELTTYFWRVDSKNQWGTTKGHIWRFTTGSANSTGEGRAMWTPAQPAVTQQLTVHYLPYGGPIDSSSTYELHWGINNFQNVVDTSMTFVSDGHYSATITIPMQANVLDFAVRNENEDYDNNNNQDWHVAVTGAPPVIELSPDPPQAGQQVALTYYAARGTLGGKESVYIHYGFNCWQSTQHILMTEESTDKWTYTFSVPAAANTLNVVFADGPADTAENWDNNGGSDWVFDVINAAPTLSWEPSPPEAGASLKLTYRDTLRVLEGTSPIYIHQGVNGWSGVIHEAMTEDSPGVWSYTTSIPGDATVVDVVFANGPEGSADIWDNNCNNDWHINVGGATSAQWGLSTTTLTPITYVGMNPTPWSFMVWNAGEGTLNWSLSKQDMGSGTGWFDFDPSSGSSTSSNDKKIFDVTFNTAGLTTGTHQGRILLIDTDGTLPNAMIDISLEVRDLNHIVVSPDSLVIDWPLSGTTTQGSFNVQTSVGSAMSFQAAVVDPGSHGWLSVSPLSGVQGGPMMPPVTINVTVDVTGLIRDSYSAEIEIKAGLADNSPVQIPVSLVAVTDLDAWVLR